MYAKNIPKKIYLDYGLKPPGCLRSFYAQPPNKNENHIVTPTYARNRFVAGVFVLKRVFHCRNPPSFWILSN